MPCQRFFNKKNNIQSSYDIGINTENYVKFYLRLRFYTILFSRWRSNNRKGTNLGEVDIIAKHGNTIIFIEVKARKNNESIFYSVTNKQQRRIMNSAIIFMSKHSQYKDCNIRFDVIFVLLGYKGKKITHIKNAFDASDIQSMVGL